MNYMEPDDVNDDQCQILHGIGGTRRCANDAYAFHEKTIRVCVPCGRDLEAEGFAIEWDVFDTCTACKQPIYEGSGCVGDLEKSVWWHVECAPHEQLITDEDHHP